MCACNMKAIQLTVSEILSGNKTWTHRRIAARPDMVMTISPAPTSWAGDKIGYLDYLDYKSGLLSCTSNFFTQK